MSSSTSDTDSENETKRHKTAAVRRPKIRREGSSSSSDSSDADSSHHPRIRRPKPSSSSLPSSPNTDRAGDFALTSPTAAMTLWSVVDYDSMSETQFYAMLKQKSRRTRQEEKRRADAAHARVKAEREDKIERFIDISTGTTTVSSTTVTMEAVTCGPVVQEVNTATKEDDESPSPSPSSIIRPRGGCDGYLYSSMLSRVYKTLEHNNPELVGGKPKPPTLPVPKIHKLSSKSTALTNFKEMCCAMKREPSHVKDFIEKELTVGTSIDGSEQALVMMVRNMKAMQVEQLFSKYVEEFCQCGNCGSIDTSLEKNEKKLLVLKCRKCLASRTVQAAVGANVRLGAKKKPKY